MSRLNRIRGGASVRAARSRAPSVRRLDAERLEPRLLLAIDAHQVAATTALPSTVDLNGTLLYADGNKLYRAGDSPAAATLLAEFDGLYIDSAATSEVVGNFLFFSANDGTHGWELWRTDGTAAGTLLLKDILPGTTSSGAQGLTAANGLVFFRADHVADSIITPELWRSDGTPEGTLCLKGSDVFSPVSMLDANGTLFVVGSTGDREQLWKSDGTVAGTVLVKDGWAYGSVGAGGIHGVLTYAGGLVYFNAGDGIHGDELWRSDGTEAGTFLLKDINPTGDSSPAGFQAAQGTVFFKASENANAVSLWKTDGSSVGTVRVAEFPSTLSSELYFVGALGARLYYTAPNAGSDTASLWATDGTPSGAIRIKDFDAYHTVVSTFAQPAGDATYFLVNDSTGTELWTTDGTANGTTLLRSLGGRAYNLRYYQVDAPAHGTFFTFALSESTSEPTQLWATNGTAAGTHAILSTDGSISQVGTALFAAASNGIWRLDGCDHDEDTPGVVDLTRAEFHLRNANTTGVADIVWSTGQTTADLISLAGDLDGDGQSTVVFYSPALSMFYTRAASDPGFATPARLFGPLAAGWLPLIGDWNGDGRDTVGLYDPHASTFYLTNFSDESHPHADAVFGFGAPGAGWLPIAGDWDGDGLDSIGLYDAATSLFYLRNSNSGGYADITVACGAAGAGWAPLAGDWDHDGVDTIGLYDPAHAVFYENNSHSSGYADVAFAFGAPGMIPIAGDWDALDGLRTTRNRLISGSFSLQSLNPLAVDLTLAAEMGGVGESMP